MELNSLVVGIAKGLKLTRDLVDAFLDRMKKKQARERLARRLKADFFELRVPGMEATVNPYLLEHLDEDMTYSRVCENVFRMIYVRQGLVMHLEELLSKPNYSMMDLILAVDSIRGSLQTLKDLILGFYIIISVMDDEKLRSYQAT
jgi:hypothetical protein